MIVSGQLAKLSQAWKRHGLLEFRRYLFLLIPPALVALWINDVRVLRLSRLRALDVDPSSGLYRFAGGPCLLAVIELLLTVVWFASGLAAR